MANEIRIQTSVQIVNDNSVANEGSADGDYTNFNLDVHSGSRTWGGKYNISTAYTDADVAYWENKVVDTTDTNVGLEDGACFESNVEASPDNDNLPATAHVVCVEYVKTLGTVANVQLMIGSEVHAVLTLGESVVIPLHAGQAPSAIFLYASAYQDGVDEATVNVLLAGV
tara:strand:+ start:2205 stop:2714 length:510 start_codon:yes stop_codon:yes gene_type:complete